LKADSFAIHTLLLASCFAKRDGLNQAGDIASILTAAEQLPRPTL
jgi:hypothetical protein